MAQLERIAYHPFGYGVDPNVIAYGIQIDTTKSVNDIKKYIVDTLTNSKSSKSFLEKITIKNCSYGNNFAITTSRGYNANNLSIRIDFDYANGNRFTKIIIDRPANETINSCSYQFIVTIGETIESVIKFITKNNERVKDKKLKFKNENRYFEGNGYVGDFINGDELELTIE